MVLKENNKEEIEENFHGFNSAHRKIWYIERNKKLPL